jgi:hypothetical protein
MTWAEVQKLSGPQLIDQMKTLQKEVKIVQQAYLNAADNECAKQLSDIALIQYVFRVRSGI